MGPARSDVAVALACDCASARIDLEHGLLAHSDALVAKALLISEVAQIARVEVRMRELLLKKWRNRVEQAALRSKSIISGGGSVGAVHKAIDAIMGKWDDDVAPAYAKDLEEAYRLARIAGHKKANGQIKGSLQYTTPNLTEDIEAGKVVGVEKARTPELVPTFDLFDDNAVAALHDDQMLWIGRHYDENVRATIRDRAKADVTQGLGRAEAGKKMEEVVRGTLSKVTVPGGFMGSDSKYFEGLAANAATNARVRGQIRSFADLGATRYEIVNPGDSRTSPICRHMNGKVFTVDQGRAQIEKTAGATTPDDIRRDHPWLSMTQVRAISPSAGAGTVSDSNKLAAAGLPLPPFHFRCRSTVDISESAGSFDSLTGAEVVPPVKPRPVPVGKPVGKPTTKPKPKPANKKPATMPARATGQVPKASKASDKAMAAFLDRNVKGVDSTSRKGLQSYLLARYGITPTRSSTAMKVRSLGRGVRGTAGWDGTVSLSRETAEGASAGAFVLARRLRAPAVRRPKGVRVGHGLATQVHEELHVASKNKSLHYFKAGKTLEEASVEVGARRILRDMGAMDASGAMAPKFKLAGKKGQWFTGDTGYNKYINDSLEALRSVTKWEPEKVLDAFETAAIMSRRKAVKIAGTPGFTPRGIAAREGDFFHQFAEHVPGLDKKKQKQLAQKLSKMPFKKGYSRDHSLEALERAF